MTMQEQSRYETRDGRVVTVQENGAIVFDHVNGYITSEVVPDAEEFFEARKDDELGRWRWPEDRKFVVYGRDDGGARVVDETTGDNWFYRREDAVHVGDPYFAASAFWEAHPVEPKPTVDEVVTMLRRVAGDASSPVLNGSVLAAQAVEVIEDLRRGRR
ncbi:hypothetical protein [Microbacterium sp. p3-SID131]|uniref:hypothetical protein n=1 Tax=Microbacterium sp. p3-SID131 TaxID=2916215 RepID=UPI0021A71936|nr:hypothetical protein [Microbacterium sp. p3-SID131]MCT1363917.1 hypothetical protein [Microbacterium sp. p3-SID131]